MADIKKSLNSLKPTEKWYSVETENRYIDFIPNADEAKEDGMFWAVTEAKVIEGSSVVIGSNTITPTLNNKSTFIEPEIPTQTEPPKNKSWFSLIQ